MISFPRFLGSITLFKIPAVTSATFLDILFIIYIIEIVEIKRVTAKFRITQPASVTAMYTFRLKNQSHEHINIHF